jgi:hypothetical protein
MMIGGRQRGRDKVILAFHVSINGQNGMDDEADVRESSDKISVQMWLSSANFAFEIYQSKCLG